MSRLATSAVIVLGKVKYGDSSVILKVYSREYGLISLIAGGLGKRKGPLKPVMMQALSHLEVVFYQNSKSDIKRLKEATIIRPHNSMLADPVKNCIAIFLADVLRQLLKEEESNYGLYDFLANSVDLLERLESGLGAFHLLFLYRLTSFTGFKPSEGDGLYFDLLSGTYTNIEPPHQHYIKEEVCQHWRTISTMDFADLQAYRPGKHIKRQFLTALLHFYRLHVNDFGELKSVEVLQEVLH